MPEPKYVIAIGSCAISGAPFHGSYSHMGGVRNVLPVDVYVGGCPPRPEAIIKGMLKITEKIRSERR